MTIYIDLILIENIIMNYIIILTTSIVCKEKVRNIRFVIASIIGALYAVVQYISEIEIYSSELIKLLLAISIVYIAFGANTLKILIKQLLIFFLTSFCFGGASYYLLHSEITQKKVLNINKTLKAAILGGIVGFIIINISFELFKKKISKKDLIYTIEIMYKDKIQKVRVLLDTGNLLKDPITNIPVIIIEKEKLTKIFPIEVLENSNFISNRLGEMNEDIKSRCSIIPFNTIGKSNGIIIGFRPDCIRIEDENQKKEKKAIIGIYNKKISKNDSYSGLIGLNILDSSEKRG